LLIRTIQTDMNVKPNYIEQSKTNITLMARRVDYVFDEIYEFNESSL
jgi:hypothetical protein